MTTLDLIRALEDQIAMWRNIMDDEPAMAMVATRMAEAAIAKAKADEAARWHGFVCTNHDIRERQSTD